MIFQLFLFGKYLRKRECLALLSVSKDKEPKTKENRMPDETGVCVEIAESEMGSEIYAIADPKWQI